nr:hypothetical protein [Kibdelosporangium sp. MJ126-NF4]CTQ99180.1 hypothetical protein [Kibdelosporangium sp. MJ126-NF4]
MPTQSDPREVEGELGIQLDPTTLHPTETKSILDGSLSCLAVTCLE